MARIRVRAWVENCGNGMYRMRTNEGTFTMPTSDFSSVQRQVDYINNEDSEGRYIEVEDEPSYEPSYHIDYENQKRIEEERDKRVRERREEEQNRIENNRKSKRSNEKYVYVISMIERGFSVTEYFKGDTNLLKIKSFATCNEKEAKVFQTKASAQKMVDTLSNVYLVKRVYRNLKVVQKKRELFAKS